MRFILSIIFVLLFSWSLCAQILTLQHGDKTKSISTQNYLEVFLNTDERDCN